jgi:hypothetical protein
LRTLNVAPDTTVTNVLPDNGLGDIM